MPVPDSGDRRWRCFYLLDDAGEVSVVPRDPATGGPRYDPSTGLIHPLTDDEVAALDESAEAEARPESACAAS